MAIKEKESIDSLDWSVDTEVQLFHAMRGHKPVGVNRYFQMACIHEKFSNSLNKEIHSQQIWSHLDTMYDLAALHESEILPFPNSEAEFVLPSIEFGEMIKTKNGGIELPITIKSEIKTIKSEPPTPEVRSKSGKELSNRVKLENPPSITPKIPKTEPEAPQKVARSESSGGKTFSLSNTPKTSRTESLSTPPPTKGGKDSNSKRAETVPNPPKTVSKVPVASTTPKSSKPENTIPSSTNTKASKDNKLSKGEGSSTSKNKDVQKGGKDGSSVAKNIKETPKGGKDSSNMPKNVKEHPRGGGKDSSSSNKHVTSQRGGKDGGNSNKNVSQKGGKDGGSSNKNVSQKGGKDGGSGNKNVSQKGGKDGGSSNKNVKETPKGGKDGSSAIKNVKDGQKGGKESRSKNTQDSHRGGKDGGSSSKNVKDTHRGGKEGSSSSKNVKAGGKEGPSRGNKADDETSSSKPKKIESREDANLRKRKRLSRQDTSKSNSPVNTPLSKRRRT